MEGVGNGVVQTPRVVTEGRRHNIEQHSRKKEGMKMGHQVKRPIITLAGL